MVYPPGGHADLTADGEAFDQTALAAAHQTLQLPAIARLTNLENGRQVVVRINDRGPATPHRLIEVTRRTASLLRFADDNAVRVRLEVLAAESYAAVDAVPGTPKLEIATAPLGEVRQSDLPPIGSVASIGAPTDVASQQNEQSGAAPALRLPEAVDAGSARSRRTVRANSANSRATQYANMQRAACCRTWRTHRQHARGAGADASGDRRAAIDRPAGRYGAGPGARVGSNRCADRGGIGVESPCSPAGKPCWHQRSWSVAHFPRPRSHITQRQQKAGAHGGKKDMAAGSPADTPLGPVDTAARWAFIMDFAHRCHAAGEGRGCPDAAFVDDQADDDLPGLRTAEARAR